MIKTWTAQLPTQNMLANFVAQQENSLKRLSTMNLLGTMTKIIMSLINLLTSLNTLAGNAARTAKESGREPAKQLGYFAFRV